MDDLRIPPGGFAFCYRPADSFDSAQKIRSNAWRYPNGWGEAASHIFVDS